MTVTSLLFPISGRGFREEKGRMWRRKRINHKIRSVTKSFDPLTSCRSITYSMDGEINH